jgi:hypothetical protein
MPIPLRSHLLEHGIVRELASRSLTLLKLYLVMLGELGRQRADEQDMRRLFHNKAGGCNRMNNTFNRGNRTSTQAFPFHDRRIHPPNSIQLSMGPVSRIEEPTALENSNGLLHRDKCGTATIQQVIADLHCATQTHGL